MVTGITSGGSDKIVDKAAITAMRVSVFVVFISVVAPVTLFS